MRFVTKTTLSRAVLAVSTLTVLAGCGLEIGRAHV